MRCSDLMAIHAMQNETVTPQLKELEQLKLSSSTKDANKFNTQNKKRCQILQWQNKKIKIKMLLVNG